MESKWFPDYFYGKLMDAVSAQSKRYMPGHKFALGKYIPRAGRVRGVAVKSTSYWNLFCLKLNSVRILLIPGGWK